jgi:DNA polymerase-3 subunit gamma/tau
MSQFIISARKYRPLKFKDVVGQEIITNSLENAISNGKLAQALLFTGPRGVGKTSCARIVAREINKFKIGDDFSYNIFELDAASNNGVDDIRNLIEQTRIPPQKGNFKVYIIDEVHMLSSGAFNAFLKTLEEPPKHCIFILATTEKHKIIPTIISRCQIYNFNRISNKDIIKNLENICSLENISHDKESLQIIATKSDGSRRDALQLFDKVLGVSKEINKEVVQSNLNSLDVNDNIKIIDCIMERDIPKLIVEINNILNKGVGGEIFISSFSSFLRDILVNKNEHSMALSLNESSKIKNLSKYSEKLSYPIIIEILSILNEAELNFQKSLNPNLHIELTFLKITSLEYSDEKKKVIFKPIPFSSFESLNFLSDVIVTEEKKEVLPAEVPIAKIDENLFASTLSLKSIEEDSGIKNIDVIDEIYIDSPNLNVSEKYMQSSWVKYAKILESNGRYNIASILRISTPVLNENLISYTVPNDTTRIEIEKEIISIQNFMRKELKNNIKLNILVDKNIKKKFKYTTSEKYNALKEKNPKIEKLKNIFKLSI